tara:strand:- start:386 stop:886 length:501 start_codon:yes stop_codon:yes gene_type:complete
MQPNKSSPFDVLQPVAPGISWTAPEKSRPWQQPPQLVNIGDVVQRYMDSFSDQEVMSNAIDAIETKVPLSVMAQSIMLNHVSEGVHTMDMGILVMPVIIELLITFAELSKVDYIVFPDQIEKQNIIPVGVARLAMKKALESMEKTAEQVQETKPAGLMARKQKEVM